MTLLVRTLDCCVVTARNGPGAADRPAACRSARFRSETCARRSGRRSSRRRVKTVIRPGSPSAQQAAFPEAICWRDQMPEKGEVDLTNYLPFLALTS